MPLLYNLTLSGCVCVCVHINHYVKKEKKLKSRPDAFAEREKRRLSERMKGKKTSTSTGGKAFPFFPRAALRVLNITCINVNELNLCIFSFFVCEPSSSVPAPCSTLCEGQDVSREAAAVGLLGGGGNS